MSELKTITLDDVEYVRKDAIPQATYKMAFSPKSDDPYVIARCSGAGVHAGYMLSYKGQEVVLRNARRLWQWHGKTLSGLAMEGSTNPSVSRYANPVDRIILTEACEIIYCTEAGRDSIEKMAPWVNK